MPTVTTQHIMQINYTGNGGRKAKLLDDAIRDYIMEKMNLRWSPEQIAGRAKRDKEPFSISFPIIYRAIDSGILPPQLKKIMRFKWKHKKCKGTDHREKIPNTTPISEHPASAENCSRYGHWKAILFSVCGKQVVLARMWNVNQDILLHSE